MGQCIGKEAKKDMEPKKNYCTNLDTISCYYEYIIG